ncbi:MAG: T9SS type A sorting domain-containing protein [Bacteroidetes bacterium]|nr:T9SS type A sorting domain-containing protein [Bacteroidota bacterium]
MSKIQKLLLSITVMGAVQLSFAQQNYVHQIIVLNEGQFDFVNQVQVTPVSIGTYDPVSKNYAYFDAINEMRWASDVVVDDNNIYVAGDTLLLVYDKNTYQLQNSLTIQGIRKLALWNNNILVSRKSGAGYGAYFQVYDKTSLNLVYELDTLNGPQYSSEGMAVYNDTCYLAVNNGFEWGNYKGLLGLIDLNSKTYTAEIDLGPDGINPDNVMIDGSNIYTLNNKNWDSTGSSITIFNTIDRTHQTYNLAKSVGGCGASVLAVNNVYFQKFNTTDSISRFNVNNQTTDAFAENIPGFVYGMVTDTINNLLYITATDYVTYGTAYIMQFDGTVIDSFSVGVSPGNMALDVRQTTGINLQSSIFNLQLKVYPNPTSSVINLEVNGNVQSYKLTLTDILGRIVYMHEVKDTKKTQTIDIQEYPQGIYLLSVETNEMKSTFKVVKH